MSLASAIFVSNEYEVVDASIEELIAWLQHCMISLMTLRSRSLSASDSARLAKLGLSADVQILGDAFDFANDVLERLRDEEKAGGYLLLSGKASRKQILAAHASGRLPHLYWAVMGARLD